MCRGRGRLKIGAVVEISQGQRAQLETVACDHGVSLVLLFGSVAAARPRPDSDLDLAVRFSGTVPAMAAVSRLQMALQKIFPERRVDLAILNRADPLFLKQITEGCVLLYGSERELAELQMYAFRRYQDHRPYLAMEREYVRRFLATHEATP